MSKSRFYNRKHGKKAKRTPTGWKSLHIKNSGYGLNSQKLKYKHSRRTNTSKRPKRTPSGWKIHYVKEHHIVGT